MITIGDRNRSRGRIKKLYIISNNKQSKYIFFLGGEGCGGRYRAAFQHVAGQSKAAKINKIRQRKLNLCRAERAESSRPRPRPGHGKRRVRFD